MYLVDSGPRVVLAFAFDAERGVISHRRDLITIAEDVGAPDGMTVDAAGDLRVAVYGGGQVRRYSPDGALHEVFDVPAEQSTSCAFGGPGLHHLFVTTATEGAEPFRPEARLIPGGGESAALSRGSRAPAAGGTRTAWW